MRLDELRHANAFGRTTVSVTSLNAHPIIRFAANQHGAGEAEGRGEVAEVCCASTIARHVDKMSDAMRPDAAVMEQRRRDLGKDAHGEPVVGKALVALKRTSAQRAKDNSTALSDSLDGLGKPHYSGSDIDHFRTCFNYVDVDLSGTLSMEEWSIFLSRMKQNLDELEAQLLFLHADSDHDGVVTMRELIAIVFQKLSNNEQRKIYIRLSEMNKVEGEQRKQRDLANMLARKQKECFMDV